MWKEGGRERDYWDFRIPMSTGHDVSFMVVVSSRFPSTCLLGTHTKGQVTVVLIPFTGTVKNPALASQPGEDSALEEDHLPLQLLESC